ncbi:unnamed protein product [Hymenolepis diminuta]|uniref:Uncharacterized protein n=1 Tax=Hymenolepis diminuta TaxID=6216 RepID=A0A564Y5P6_HYMDI|nr:unnamed protein product [Hymenolepis diminuta]
MYRIMSHLALNDHSPLKILIERKPKTIHNPVLPKDSTFPNLSSYVKKSLEIGAPVYVRDQWPNGTWVQGIIRARRWSFFDIILNVYGLPQLGNNEIPEIKPSNQQNLR